MKSHYLKDELYQLIQSDQRIFDFLQEASLDGIWYWNLEKPDEEWMSPEFWKTLGYDPQEMPHQSSAWQHLIHPDDLETSKRNLEKHLKDPSHPYDQIVRYRHKAGHTVWVRCRGLALRDETGRPTRMLGAHNDFTRLKETEARVAKENRQLNAIFGHSGLYIIVIDLEGKFTYFNNKFNEDFGWNPLVTIGKYSLPSIHPDDQAACIEVVEQCFQFLGQAFPVDLRKPKKTGGWQTNHWNFSAQVNAQGAPESILCIGYDISHNKKIQREYQLLVDNIGDAVVATDPDGKILYTSKSWAAYFLLDPQAAEGVPLYQYCHESDRAALEQLISSLSRDYKPSATLQHRLRLGDSTLRWVETKCTLDSDGNRLVFLIRDISERKQAEEELRRSQEQLASLAANVPGAVLQYKLNPDQSEELLYLSQGAIDIWGIRPEEAIKDISLIWDTIPPEQFIKLQAAIKASARTLTIFSHEWQIRHKNGSVKWVSGKGTPKQLPDGSVIWNTLIVDITALKKTQQKLQSSQKQLHKLTASVPGAIYQMEIDPEGNIAFTFVSEGITAMYEKLTPAVLLENAQLAFSMIHPDDLPQIMTKIEDSKARLTPFFADYRIILPNGQIKWSRAMSSPERREDGTVVWYGIFQDINELRKIEEIRKQAQELKIKNKELEQFTYVASHDLQEPLRTIKSYSGLLSQRFADDLNEDGQQFLKFIGEAALRMSNLIKGLLEYSQIGRDRKASSVDCNALVAEVIQDLNSSIERHNAQIEVGVLPELEGYRMELQQLFQNLISNAIKFHKPGQSPKIEIRAEEKADHWQFSIKDNGIGIPPQYQEKIFSMFQRLHLAKDYDGTGIGLAHCKKITEMHHGNIWLESAEGAGATFYFTLKKGGYDSEAEKDIAH